MTLTNILTVLGATGNQGTAVLQHFASQQDAVPFKLRGVTRNTSSAAARELQDLGVEMIQADLDDVTSLQSAFEGSTHIFATTDSNRLIHAAAKDPSILKDGQTPRAYAREIELKQGRNIVQAAVATQSLQRLVWSSLPSPKKLSKGKYTKVSMFDTKDDICDILFSTPDLKNKISVLMVGFYAHNPLEGSKLYGTRKRDDGVYEMSLPIDGDVSVPWADLGVDMGRWVEALFSAEPGVKLVGSTEDISWKGWLKLWAERNGVQAEYIRADDNEYAKRVPGIGDAVLEELKFVEEFGFAGGDKSVLWPDDLRRRGIALKESKISDHIARTDWSTLL